jgi:hypothetical protein
VADTGDFEGLHAQFYQSWRMSAFGSSATHDPVLVLHVM